MRIRTVAILGTLVFGLGLMPELTAKERQPAAYAGEDFFIISSVNLPKRRIVRKRPTEVTELVSVNDQTVFLGEQGNHLQLGELRAGDTVYVTLAATPGGPRMVRRIRKGIMTVEGLRRPYLTFR